MKYSAGSATVCYSVRSFPHLLSLVGLLHLLALRDRRHHSAVRQVQKTLKRPGRESEEPPSLELTVAGAASSAGRTSIKPGNRPDLIYPP